MSIKNGRFLQIFLLVMLLFTGLAFSIAAYLPSAQAEVGDNPNGLATHIIRFRETAVIPQLAAQPTAGKRPFAADMTALAYQQTLTRAQDQALARIGATLGRDLVVRYRYTWTLNAVAASLTPAEAATIAALPEVAAVTPSRRFWPTTDAGPAWIGAPALWDGSQTGGAPGTRGEGILIGIIDTGINIDHPSFAAVGGDGYVHTNPFGAGHYRGQCAAQPEVTICNDKLVGAYSWPEVGDNPEDDYWGHGSNVAAIAAGNVVTLPYAAPTIVLTPTLSGVAPHANLIAYDVCSPSVGCPDSVMLAAIEQAILDGVDVVNFSIGGAPQNPWEDPLALSFLAVREAGIFVATSAGNNGPNTASINAPANAPWMTAAGNATHNARFVNVLGAFSGGSGPLPDLVGSSITAGYGPAPIVAASAVAPTNANCTQDFPPGMFSNGEIVYCTSGGSRLAKAQKVLAAGGGGIVADNNQSLYQDLSFTWYPLPGVNLLTADSAQLESWLASGTGHTAVISGTERVFDPAYGDEMNRRSSRGPNPVAVDVLKPNVTAPGTNIWAAGMTTNPADPPELTFFTGTSQASPHVAGAAALLRALHPDWTPAEIESALMTTAVTSLTDYDSTPAGTFTQGAGRIDLTAAARAGLVLAETAAAFRAANPVLGQDASALNLAALTEANCGSVCTWTRQLRSTLPVTATWEITVQQPVTAVLTMTPTRFTLPPGSMQTITITADASSLAAASWDFGTVWLSETGGQAPDAHLPVSLRPGETNLVDAITIHTRRSAGSHEQTGLQASGITSLTVSAYNLVPGVITNTQIISGSRVTVTLDVPANSQRLAAEILETTAVDLNLYVQKAGDPLGAACGADSEGWQEQCDVLTPAAGVYEVVVQNVTGSGGGDDVAAATAVVADALATNNWVAGPVGQAVAEPFALRLYWQEPAMQAGDRWYGGLSLGTAPDHPADIGFIPVNLVRYEDDLSKVMAPVTGTLSSVFTTTIVIQPNVAPVPFTYALTETLPAGFHLIDPPALPGVITQTGQSWQWQGVLPPLAVDPVILTYRAEADAAACQTTAGSRLTAALDNPGSETVSVIAHVAVACAQRYLPVVFKSLP